ncbi:unnamed protein product [Triticum turgidum subsp. durum]|uniref:DUF4220 domain-containing protein n=1 Tax=Triticum turgidum subsp. durum TaxID=4567 RepID=A0A9R1RUX9_TRITD|nr:unnamed protein product [Triticum turgidum subsp. durum]
MGNVEQHSGNATPTTFLHYQLSDMWRSPRGTVLRIEGFALVAIACSFFLVAFGSCRRWSNRWIIQNGFLAAQVLSLSLGTYSIGLMQSSPVKSEMYPIWAVSLLTLFGCIDPVTNYIGLEYKGPLLKMIFQLCLYCGYVLLMSVSTISGSVGKLAICVLSVVTFMKGFHMSLALVQPSRGRDELALINPAFAYKEPRALAGEGEELLVHLKEPTFLGDRYFSMADINSSCEEMLDRLQLKEITVKDIRDVCLGYSLSHLLQRHFLGLETPREMEFKIEEFESIAWEDIDYKRTLKAIEVELTFLYDVFFTSNGFLHCDEAKTSSFWAFASFIGICFVGVATAIPGAMSSQHSITGGSNNSPGAGAGTIVVVNTTRVDLIITLVILVSLALLQLVQLIRCWTSNWARVAFACDYARNRSRQESTTTDPESCEQISFNSKKQQVSGWMRLKAFVVTRMNWFDKYLWQDKLGQYSLLDEAARRESRQGFHLVCVELCELLAKTRCGRACGRLRRMLGLQYIGRVLRELWAYDNVKALWAPGIEGSGNCCTAVRLHDDVKASIADFLGKIESRRIGVKWSSLFDENGIDLACLPYSTVPLRLSPGTIMSDAFAFSNRVLIWHVATCYCEVAEPHEGSAGVGGGSGTRERNRNRRVAMELSRYCAYLVVSAPELLPGPSVEAKRAHLIATTLFHEKNQKKSIHWGRRRTSLLEDMQQLLEKIQKRLPAGFPSDKEDAIEMGVHWGMRLLNQRPPPPGCTPRRRSDDHWEVLALLWVQTLLYAAPYGDMQKHMQRLSQGGEFITHLWALLYHMGIDRWDSEPAQAAAGETREAAQVQGDVKDREPEAAAAETTQKTEAAHATGETREAAQVQGYAREAEIQEIV